MDPRGRFGRGRTRKKTVDRIPKPRNTRNVAYMVTLLYVGGMLNIPIPRALVRELGLVKRTRVTIARGTGRQLIIEDLEDYLRERRAPRGRPAR